MPVSIQISIPNRRNISSQRGLRLQGSNIFLMLVAILMFLGGTIFLCLDISDLVRRMQIVLINHPGQTDLEEKLAQANDELKELVWVGEILFIFMVSDEGMITHFLEAVDRFLDNSWGLCCRVEGVGHMLR